ncbi:hypothetical protein ACIP3U_33970 [[Kitasatospora] papulosa]
MSNIRGQDPLHHCDVISINSPSYRLKSRLAAIERDQASAA